MIWSLAFSKRYSKDMCLVISMVRLMMLSYSSRMLN